MSTNHAELITDPRRQRNILIAMCTALIAVVASVSGLNVAQQTLAIELGATQSQLLWIINGYTLALAALLMPVGAIGDRWGRKPILISGLVLFVVANLVGAFSGSVEVMILARVAAGAAAAMIMPVTLSVITSGFPAHERARAVGIWAGFAGAGGILGLFVSAVIVDRFTWPWLFAMPIGLAVLALFMSLRSISNSREASSGRFDTVGSVLSALAIGGLVLGIHEGPERGWSDPVALAGLIIGGLALVGFIVWELRQTHPLMQIRLFADRNLAAGVVTLLVIFTVMLGIFLVLTQFLQAVLGYSAVKSAAGLLPMMAVMMPLSSLAPAISERIGVRRTMIVGVSSFIAGLALLASMVSVSGGYLSILPGLLIVAVGIGLCMTPSTTLITGSLPQEKQGVASALNDTVREVGSSIGVALLGSILAAGYRSSVSGATTSLSPELAHQVEEGIGSAFAAAPQMGDAAPSVLAAAREALVEGWQAAMWVGVGLASIALVYLLVRGPRADEAADTGAGERVLEAAGAS